MSQRPRLQWYRWEGVYAADFTLEGMRRRCRRVGDVLLARQWSCLVAHDTRFMGAQFARYAYRVLEAQNVRLGFCLTPASVPMIELALERKRFDTALIVSAGNRPHWYNGIHIAAPALDTSPLDEGTSPLAEPAPPLFPPEPLPATEQNQIDVRGPYLEMLRGIVDIDMIRRSTLTFFVDAMSGTTSGVIPAIIGEGAQTRAIEINRDSDPLLGRQTPTPIETTMTRVRKLVKDSDSHLGIAISADGRALGVTDNTGELASTLEVALLLGQHLARQHRERGLIVVPSLGDELPGVRAWEQATGNKVEFAADPVARIAEITSQDRTNPLVGMTAGGEVIVGRYSATFDAMLAGLLLIEMIAYSNNKLRAPLDELRSRLNQQSA